MYETPYVDGKPTGIRKDYDESGNLVRKTKVSELIKKNVIRK